MTFRVLIMLACAVWLFSCGAALLALYWNFKAGSRRTRAALISSGVALLSGYWGLSHFQYSASKTVNDHLEWSINSKWFFISALVLGSAALAVTFWNWKKTVAGGEIRVPSS